MRILLATLITLAALPAEASTVPRVDLKAGQTTVALGAVDLDVDRALDDRLAVGANTNVLSLAARLTYRLGGDPDGFCWGLALAGGPSVYPGTNWYGSPYGVTTQFGPSGFFQPAVVWSSALGRDLFFRGTFGPVFFAQYNTQGGGSYRYIESMLVPWANFELAYRIKGAEITLGGGLLGVRFTL